MSMSRFHWLDYVVTVAMLVVSLAIGFFFALFKGGQKTKIEYLLGNREMGMVPVCLSLFVTFTSAISLIGTPSDTYDTGPMIMYNSFGFGLAYLVGYFTVVPLMYPLHLTSVYEYLGLRFQSTAVRLLGTCIGMLQTELYMAVALFSPALALQAAAGLPLWVSVAIVGSIGTLYTAVGGIKSVVWTDAFQTIVLFIGVFTVLIKGILAVGGFTRMFDIAEEGGRTNFAELNPDPRERHSLWGCIFGGCVIWLTNCFNQSAVQRIGSLKTLKAAKQTFLLNVPLNALHGVILALTGILLYSYIVTVGCDPYAAGQITNKNQMMPYFVIHVLVDLPGMAGLYMSMLFSGALSTVSSGISALAANSVEDLLARPLRGLRDTTVTLIAKALVVFYGLLTIGLAYSMKSMAGSVSQIATSAFGACGGPMVGMFLLGGAFPWGNEYGAIGGGLIGMVVNLWIALGTRMYGAPLVSLPPGPTHNCSGLDNTTFLMGNNDSFADVTIHDVMTSAASEGFDLTTMAWNANVNSTSLERHFSMYDISYVWFGVIGVLTSVICGIIISCITGCQDPETLDPKLIIPIFRKLYRLPESVPKPEDVSNVVAMQNYRHAWDTFKQQSIELDVIERENSQPLNTQPNNGNSERLSFLKRNGQDDY
ncbi:sodium-coupled monocarboxylate transporter 1-like [Littorina saxatilis]|uniref:Sodium-coupled monocarboxylate transporter 1 n=1 Tax=Littorina saxatilis TaxID=31220 RepID=A0AAN9GDV7_9CAEN